MQVTDRPIVCKEHLIDLIADYFSDRNYLFYSTADTEVQYDEAYEPHYAIYCTACNETTFLPKRKTRVKSLAACPHCGADIQKVHKQGKHDIDCGYFYFYYVQADALGTIWITAYDTKCTVGCEGRRYTIVDQCVYAVRGDCAKRWARRSGCHALEERQKVCGSASAFLCETRGMSNFGDIPPRNLLFAADFDSKKTCFPYFDWDFLDRAELDIVDTLVFYRKYPMQFERLLLQGFENHLARGIYAPQRLKKAFDFRKKDKAFYRGLDKLEITQATEQSLDEMIVYAKCKKMLQLQNTAFDWQFCGAMDMHSALLGREGFDVPKIYQYVKSQRKFYRNVSVRAIFMDFCDYCTQVDRLGGAYFPKDLRYMHEQLSNRLRDLGESEAANLYRMRRRQWKWLCFAQDGLFIRPLRDANEFEVEGKSNRNCVAGYSKSHAQGNTIVLVLRAKKQPKTSLVTVEVNPETMTVRQARAYRNGEINVQCAKFLEVWKEHIQNEQIKRANGGMHRAVAQRARQRDCHAV